MEPTGKISLNTETEHLLYNHYQAERKTRLSLENQVSDLKSQIEELQCYVKHIKELNKVTLEKDTSEELPLSSVQYETDEEDLAKETEWIRHKSRKKRKLNTSPSSPKEPEPAKEKVKKALLPPPIVVESIKDYQKFYDLLSTNVNKDTFIAKIMNGESVKINANNEDSYRCVTKLLTDNQCLWFSYENKQNRPIRVMAKNLHSSCLSDRIIDDLKVGGYKIQDAVNKRSWRSKEPLNMFILSFQKDEDISKIYGIKSILGCKVEIQPLKTNRLIPQCKRCQAYGHTQKYCSKEPRCVKCTAKHLTKDCTKPAAAKPKCVHCGEQHPANYRGCLVAKELQSIKNNLTKKNVPAPVTQLPTASKIIKPTTKKATERISYAQMAKGIQPHPLPQLQTQPSKPGTMSHEMDEKLNKILSLVTSYDKRLKKLESSFNLPATLKQNQ